MVRVWLPGLGGSMPGALPLLSPTHLGWDFKRKEVEAPGSQGLQREEKKVSSKWWLPRPSSPCLPLVSSACVQPLPAGALYPGVVSLSHAPPLPSFLDIYAVQYASLPGYVFSALPHFCLPCPLVSLPSAAQLPLIPAPAPKPSALTSTRSSNFLGFVSSFTRCCWSTAPWLRHLRMLSTGG